MQLDTDATKITKDAPTLCGSASFKKSGRVIESEDTISDFKITFLRKFGMGNFIKGVIFISLAAKLRIDIDILAYTVASGS